MLGHILCDFLNSSNKYHLINISRKKYNSETIILDVTNYDKLKKIIIEHKPTYIINCAGVLVSDSSNDPINAIKVNSLLPHQLKEIADKLNSSIIQISSDCVFDGHIGKYTENSETCPSDIYGRTKLLGEIYGPNHLVIRTSIIGPELYNNSRGLFSWILNNKGSDNIEGYFKSIWSGITTIELSKSIIYCIENKIYGLLHICKNPISKYELLNLINEKFNLNLRIIKVDGKISDKSLLSVRSDFKYEIPSYEVMISNLKEYMNLKKI